MQCERLCKSDRDLHARHLLVQVLDPGFPDRAVVTPDVEDQGVVEFALLLDLLDHSACLRISVFGEPGKEFHHATLKRLFAFGDRISRRHRFREIGQLRFLRNPA